MTQSNSSDTGGTTGRRSRKARFVIAAVVLVGVGVAVGALAKEAPVGWAGWGGWHHRGESLCLKDQQRHITGVITSIMKAQSVNRMGAKPTRWNLAAVQPALGAGVLAQGGLPVLLGLHLAVLGWAVPRPMVHSDHAFAHRADEEDGSHPAQSSHVTAQLVPRQRGDLGRHCRRIQHQGETDPEKVLRVSDLSSHGNRPVSWPWRSTRTASNPQILLRSRKKRGSNGFVRLPKVGHR